MYNQWGLPSLGLIPVLDLEKSGPEEFSLAVDFLKSQQDSEETVNGYGR